MTLKLNISNKGKAWKIELEPAALSGKSIGDKIPGKDVKEDLEGYELEITGGSDLSGLPMDKNVEGIGLKRVLRTKGFGLWSKPRGEKKKQPRMNKGLRLRKTARGKTISEKTIQVNINVIKEGTKKLEEIFPDQNKTPEPVAKEAPKEQPKEAPAQEAPKEAPRVEAPKTEEKPEENKEQKVEEKPIETSKEETKNEQSN